MKKYVFNLVFLLLIHSVLHQSIAAIHVLPKPHRFESVCNQALFLADSVIQYYWDETASKWSEENIILYEYDSNDNIVKVVSRKILSGINIYRQLYTYDHNQNRTKYVYQLWIDGSWVNNRMVLYNFNQDQINDQTVYHAWNSDHWEPYQVSLNYYNENGDIAYFLRRVKDQNGEFYDYSYDYYIYDANNNLIEEYGIRISDNFLTWKRVSFYDSENKIYERIRYRQEWNPYTRVYDLNPSQRFLYFYDEFGINREVIIQKWNGQEWINEVRNLSYVRFDAYKRVPVCHNGRTIWISKNAVPAHLRHGDCLGECLVEQRRKGKKSATLEDELEKEFTVNGLRIYPNPAKDVINISFNNNELQVRKIELIDLSGRMLMQVPVNNETLVSIPRGDLQKGVYFVRVYGKEMENRIVVIE